MQMFSSMILHASGFIQVFQVPKSATKYIDKPNLRISKYYSINLFFKKNIRIDEFFHIK